MKCFICDLLGVCLCLVVRDLLGTMLLWWVVCFCVSLVMRCEFPRDCLMVGWVIAAVFGICCFRFVAVCFWVWLSGLFWVDVVVFDY